MSQKKEMQTAEQCANSPQMATNKHSYPNRNVYLSLCLRSRNNLSLVIRIYGTARAYIHQLTHVYSPHMASLWGRSKSDCRAYRLTFGVGQIAANNSCRRSCAQGGSPSEACCRIAGHDDAGTSSLASCIGGGPSKSWCNKGK